MLGRPVVTRLGRLGRVGRLVGQLHARLGSSRAWAGFGAAGFRWAIRAAPGPPCAHPPWVGLPWPARPCATVGCFSFSGELAILFNMAEVCEIRNKSNKNHKNVKPVLFSS